MFLFIKFQVSGWVDHNVISNLGFSFSGVDLKNLTKIKPRLYKVLHQLSTGAMKIDMSVVKTFLDNLAIREASSFEGNPHSVIANIVIQEAIYGTSCSDVSVEYVF